MATDPGTATPAASSGGRLQIIDLVRAVALLAMASYHFSWDLEYFGYLEPGSTGHGLFKLYARSIASSFLFLVGVSLVLAHWPRFRFDGFLKRIAMVAGAAALISLATWIATPDQFIFFGILHEIALASLLGLAFVRLPPALTLAVALAVVALPQLFRAEFFDAPWLWWVGLSAHVPRSNDYVPLFPWFGAVLAGIALTRLAIATGLRERLQRIRLPGTPLVRLLRFAGRHSLAFYLVHQPVLIAIVWTVSQILPPAGADPVQAYVASCEQGCVQDNDMAMCQRFCGCVMEELLGRDLFAPLQSGAIDPLKDDRVGEIARACTMRAQTP
ncbi:putative membrane protein [Hoeflea marina]|uniref:Putative membrane protein n=1 Tax=Hoeflea marina TaxID=274592 RepID=A0A317PR48_9HYPH|nr:DUF1624 domain-containing protein [Hoeflea marina]PWW03649.1 putative membrane protein [Hoeflea marina]